MEDTPKDLWAKLKADYEVVDAQLLFVKRNKFLFCKKARSETMESYLSRLTSLKQELTDAGSDVSDSDFILTIMNGTHEDYGDFVSAISGKQTIDKLVVGTLMTQLKQEDDLRRSINHKEKGASGSENRLLFTKKEISKQK